MAIRRRIYKQGGSLVISIPDWAWKLIGLKRGDYVDVEAYPNQMLTVTPLRKGVEGEKQE